MILKKAIPIVFVAVLGVSGTALAHETTTGARQGQGAARQVAPCPNANGQLTACERNQGIAPHGRQGAVTGAGDQHGPGMMLGDDFMPGQGIRQVPESGRTMNLNTR